MNIGIYETPTNSNMPDYRGLYRQNNFIDQYESLHLIDRKLFDWYISFSHEGIYIEFSKANLRRLCLMTKTLQENGWAGELILFTDKKSTAIPTGFSLLGYDICADSRYYSPIGDGFLKAYNNTDIFFSAMTIDEYTIYKAHINENILFESYSTAFNFSKYCNSINHSYFHSIESEHNWRPFAVYAFHNTRRTRGRFCVNPVKKLWLNGAKR